MRDFGDKRSTTRNQAPKAADVGLAPGKRTLVVEMLPHPASAPEMSLPASEPVQTKAEIEPAPATPTGPRLTALDLFGRVQRKATGAEPDAAAVHGSAQQGIATSSSPLPHAEAIQRLFGRHDISNIQAHTGGAAAEAAHAMSARAYATGNHVVFGSANDLHTAAHEAAHVVQQRGGVQLKGGVGEVGDGYEQHADAVAELVVRGESAEGLLDRYAGTGPAIASAGSGIQRQVDDPDVLRDYEITKTGGIDVDDEAKAELRNKANLDILKPIVNRNPGNFRRVYQYIAHDVTTAAQRATNLEQFRTLVDATAVTIGESHKATADDTAFLGHIQTAVLTHDQPIKHYLAGMKNKVPQLRELVALDPAALDLIAELVHNNAKPELKSLGAMPSLLDAYRVCRPGAGASRWNWGPGNKGSADTNMEAHIDKHILYIGGDASAKTEGWKWKEVIGYDLGTADLSGLGLDPLVLQEIEQCLGTTGQLDSSLKYEEFFVTKRFQDLGPIKDKLRAAWGQQYLALASNLTQGMTRYVTCKDFVWHRVHGQVNHRGHDIFIIGKVIGGAVTISSAYIPYQDEHTGLLPYLAWQV